MKFKCIKEYCTDDSIIMTLGDIVTLNKHNLCNITKGIIYTNIFNMDEVRESLEVITDDFDFETNEITDVFRFEEITRGMLELFKKKNHDYGNSFEQSLNEEGLAAARIRMGDKWNRFKSLSKGNDALVNDESISDTLIDLANYSIMTLIWLSKQE